MAVVPLPSVLLLAHLAQAAQSRFVSFIIGSSIPASMPNLPAALTQRAAGLVPNIQVCACV